VVRRGPRQRDLDPISAEIEKLKTAVDRRDFGAPASWTKIW
jgi:hypothetical protein